MPYAGVCLVPEEDDEGESHAIASLLVVRYVQSHWRGLFLFLGCGYQVYVLFLGYIRMGRARGGEEDFILHSISIHNYEYHYYYLRKTRDHSIVKSLNTDFEHTHAYKKDIPRAKSLSVQPSITTNTLIKRAESRPSISKQPTNLYLCCTQKKNAFLNSSTHHVAHSRPWNGRTTPFRPQPHHHGPPRLARRRPRPEIRKDECCVSFNFLGYLLFYSLSPPHYLDQK